MKTIQILLWLIRNELTCGHPPIAPLCIYQKTTNEDFK